ncbi:MAG: hypothetical protein ABIP74_04730, partial [Candidatus Saccharimonas sp.]
DRVQERTQDQGRRHSNASELYSTLTEMYGDVDAILLHGTEEEQTLLEGAIRRLSDIVALRQRQAAFEYGLD